jgi:hypothetical protein
MNRDTKLEKVFMWKAADLLRRMRAAGYSSEESVSLLFVAIESTYPDVHAEFECGEMVISGDVVTH